MELSKSQSFRTLIEPCFKILNKIEGNIDCFNDIIIFKNNELKAKFNVIYFGGDIQVKTEISTIILTKSFI